MIGSPSFFATANSFVGKQNEATPMVFSAGPSCWMAEPNRLE
jgi:hypothetical protein